MSSKVKKGDETIIPKKRGRPSKKILETDDIKSQASTDEINVVDEVSNKLLLSKEDLKQLKKQEKIDGKNRKEQQKQDELLRKEQQKQEEYMKEQQEQNEIKIRNDYKVIRNDTIKADLKCDDFEVIDKDTVVYNVKSKQELMNVYLSKPNNTLFIKIKQNQVYKPYFQFKIEHKETDKPSKISCKNETALNIRIQAICKYFDIKYEEAEKLFSVKMTTENIKTNLKGNLTITTFDIVINEYKCICSYYLDVISLFSGDKLFHLDIYNKDYKYPIDMNDDFNKLITVHNASYKDIKILDQLKTDETKYFSNERASKVFKAVELYDRKALKYMINNINFIREICNYKENSKGKYDYDIAIHLKKIWNGLKNENQLEVLFVPTENNVNGRKYANNASYQNISRKIRHTLARDYYIDIDFVNCHFVLLKHICQLYKLDEDKYKCISKYVDDRDYYINDIKKMYNKSRDEAKSLIISITYGADIVLDKLKWFNNFRSEIKYLSEFFSTHYDFKHYLEISGGEIKNEALEALQKGEKPKIPNLYGKTLSKILCSYENTCLEALLEFLKLNKIGFSALAFDGCMVDKNNDRIKNGEGKELLLEANEYIYSKTNIHINTIYKKLDDIIELPNDYIYTLEDVYIIEAGHDVDASNIIIEHFGYLYIKCNGVKYVKNDNIWISDEKEIKEIITKHIKSVNIQYQIGKGFVSYTQSYTHIKACYELVLLNGFKEDNLFIENNQKLTKYYLPFIDGIYSYKDKKFYCYDKLSHLNFTQRIHLKIPTFNQKDTDELYYRILKPIYPNEIELKYYLHSCSRALAGCYSDKKWYVGVGARNCGKSVLTTLFKKSFGCFVSSFDAKTLIYNKYGNPEPARALGWVVGVKDCRLIISNEIGTDDEKAVLNGNFIKTLASAGDEMSGRLLYKNIITFIPQFTMFLNCNRLPDINPIDAMENLEQFNYKSQFVDEDELLNGCSYLKLKDDGVKELIIEQRIIDAFILVVLNAFENNRIKTPYEISISSEIAKGNIVITKEKFCLTNFKTTNNKEDKLHTEDIQRILNQNNYNLNVVEVGRLITSLSIGVYNKHTSIRIENANVRKAGFEYLKYTGTI